MEIIRATKTAHQAGAYYVRIQAMLGRVVVLPECRNKGIGTFVVKEAEKWAKGWAFILLSWKAVITRYRWPSISSVLLYRCSKTVKKS